MKRIYLMMVIAAGLLVPSAAFVGQAGADGPPTGTKQDPTSSCGGSSGSKPAGCENPMLPQSEGCQHGQAPVQNPHCTPAATSTPETPTSTPTVATPAAPEVAGETDTGGKKKGDVAGQKEQAAAAAAAAQPARPGQELAYTGDETMWLALLGAVLLIGGLVLRARAGDSVAEQQEPPAVAVAQPAAAVAQPGETGEERTFTGSEAVRVVLVGAVVLTAGLALLARGGDAS